MATAIGSTQGGSAAVVLWLLQLRGQVLLPDRAAQRRLLDLSVPGRVLPDRKCSAAWRRRVII